jgi:hypothetical protein
MKHPVGKYKEGSVDLIDSDVMSNPDFHNLGVERTDLWDKLF